MIPVRCFSCGKVVAHFWEDFQRRINTGESGEKILNDFGLQRYCCRGILLSHVDLLKKISKFA
ncbi:MAG: DNA-directed RNA polymerase subunit N [Candidatus Aenigmarchaeota archaeon]|nr:DNA-directed RNA polymerase subunit N [Candidatus Aenigmarchaeota archaeon]